MRLMRMLMWCACKNNFCFRSEDILIYFVAHCFKNLKLLHTTIKLYLCGIRFHYVKSNCEHPFDSAHESTILRLNMIMRAVKRIQGEHNTKQRNGLLWCVESLQAKSVLENKS